MREAIAAASPDLAAALDRGERPPAAMRYVRRMAGRPTPFGLMASVSVGDLGARTRLQVEAVPRLHATSGRNAALVPNPALHDAGERLHLLDRARSVRATPAIRAALAGDRGGPPEFLARLVQEGVLVVAEPAWRQLESVRPAPGLTLGPDEVAELARAADVLCALTPARPPAAIRRFCERFVARWGDGEVPLLLAMDHELGIGLPDPPPDVEWGPREQRMLDVIASGAGEWDLAGEELGGGRPAPPSFAVQAACAADGSLRVHGVSGPSGVRLFARHIVARELVDAQVRAEETLDPDTVYASVPWHGERGGPVLAPLGLRRHEIDPADLTVRVVDGVPLLRSANSGRRVVPRIDSAHDFRAVRDPVYRFLGLMQDPHGEGWVTWRWGALASAARLPRVRHGNLVLAPAQWRHPRVEDLPEWVCVVDRGRELPVPREEAAGVPLVREMWPPPDRLAMPYVHDMIVPFTASVAAEPEPRPAARGRIVFKPGSEWSSIRLCCGPATADDVLLDTVLPLVRGSQWFFLRYDEPEWHLRVRARGIDLAPLAADERVWRAEIDTYVRETARYGDIEAAERCFHADSEAVAALLRSGIERRHLAIAGVAALFEDAGAEATFPGLGRSHAKRVRAERPAVEEVLAMELFAERSARWRDDLAGVDLPSLAHMHVNRVLRSGHREEEPLVYDFLATTQRTSAGVASTLPAASTERTRKV